MSIKKITFDTVVILGFLVGTGFLFNYILGTPLSNPLVGNTITTEEQA
ncbi:hypothetical protein cce_4444 [Crocosphaera subtropica ATCC 51142]|uniref:Uncharacterized protein n=1 Tax=Crocosphaera subtropica (strain ATCC 51142 / BH68) TaxID=43989 RepID=B1WUD8_CROS5|nr:hypothetical protein [Crocosphaera subtropica]ACB53792.1 hypothetical protein cce_4444 [Crocosphaera subtropica ATCC 51142]